MKIRSLPEVLTISCYANRVGNFFLNCLKFTSYAMLLPLDGIYNAWKNGNKLGNKAGDEAQAGYLLGGTLAGMSALITAATYVFAAPLVFKAAINAVLPTLTNFAPVVIKTLSPATKLTTALLSTISNYILFPVFVPLSQTVKSFWPKADAKSNLEVNLNLVEENSTPQDSVEEVSQI